MDELYLNAAAADLSAKYDAATAAHAARAANGTFLLVSGCPTDGAGRALDAEEILALYERHGARVTHTLFGLYSLIVAEPEARRAYLFQDAFGAGRALYFRRTGTGFVVSTSLKRVLKSISAPRKMCDDAAEAYLVYGAVLNEQTLVEGVYKLPVRRYAVLDFQTGEYILKKSVYDEKALHKPGEKAYTDALKDAFAQTYADKPIGMTLSSGFDSNLLLRLLREETNQPIWAFSVGGAKGVDETRDAERIAQTYDNLRFTRAVVDAETLERLPDIVYRLEGSVYERGVFLQYALMQSVSAAGLARMVLGEGADQVLSLYYCKTADALLKLYGRLFTSHRLHARDMLSNVILRKNTLMLGSAGIRCAYPYLYEPFLRVARALYGKNRIDKRFHVRLTKARMGAQRAEYLKKIAGSTELEAVFAKDIPYARFRRMALGLRWHTPGRAVYDKNGRMQAEANYCVALMTLKLFEDIFLSGRYDARFDEAGFSVPLHTFLEAIPEKADIAPVRIVGRSRVYRTLRQCYRALMR